MCNHFYNFYELYTYINLGFHASCYTSDFMFFNSPLINRWALSTVSTKDH